MENLKSLDREEKNALLAMVKRHAQQTQQYIGVTKTILSPPPPRTYICALNGTSYKSIDGLRKAVYDLTRKYGAHVHGLLVLNGKRADWLITTKAFANGETKISSKNAFWEFIQKMNLDFQGLAVGKYPASNA